MNSTHQRDRACRLAQRDPRKALELARQITDPWFRVQALAEILMHTPGDPGGVARLASDAAAECPDDYQRTAVRAWEIAALAGRDRMDEARQVLKAALRQSWSVTPSSSRAEALLLLLHAALRIGPQDAKRVFEDLACACAHDGHWRCKRALRMASLLRERKCEPRQFFRGGS